MNIMISQEKPLYQFVSYEVKDIQRYLERVFLSSLYAVIASKSPSAEEYPENTSTPASLILSPPIPRSLISPKRFLSSPASIPPYSSPELSPVDIRTVLGTC